MQQYYDDAGKETYKGEEALEDALEELANAVDDGIKANKAMEEQMQQAKERLDKGAKYLMQVTAALRAVMDEVLTPEQRSHIAVHLEGVDTF